MTLKKNQYFLQFGLGLKWFFEKANPKDFQNHYDFSKPNKKLVL